MAQMCHSCRGRTAAIHCLTGNTNYCLTCDYLHFHVGISGHLRYQLCDNCMLNPSSLVCSNHQIILCQSCYSLHYNCATFGHRIQSVNHFPQHYNGHDYDHEHENHVDDYQRREGMFQMSCNGNNDCERWMFALECESCLASSAVVYCAQEDYLLCDVCDRIKHSHEAIPPHMRCKLCVTCKRLSRSFLIGAYHFNLPPTHPFSVAAEEVSASASSGPSRQDEMESSVNEGAERPSRVRFMLSRLSLHD